MGKLRARAPVHPHRSRERGQRPAAGDGGQSQRHRRQGPVADRRAQWHVAQHAVGIAGDVEQGAVARHRRAVRQQHARRAVPDARAARRAGMRRAPARPGSRRRCVIQARMHARGTEQEASVAAFGHRFQRGVADRIVVRRFQEHHVVADRAHAGAIQRIEQVRMLLPAPWPRPRCACRSSSRRSRPRPRVPDGCRLPWPQLDHLVEDRVFGRSQVAVVLPVPRQPRQRGQRQQRIEREAQAQRDARVGTSIAALEPAPAIDERMPDPRPARLRAMPARAGCVA